MIKNITYAERNRMLEAIKAIPCPEILALTQVEAIREAAQPVSRKDAVMLLKRAYHGLEHFRNQHATTGQLSYAVADTALAMREINDELAALEETEKYGDWSGVGKQPTKKELDPVSSQVHAAKQHARGTTLAVSGSLYVCGRHFSQKDVSDKPSWYGVLWVAVYAGDGRGWHHAAGDAIARVEAIHDSHSFYQLRVTFKTKLHGEDSWLFSRQADGAYTAYTGEVAVLFLAQKVGTSEEVPEGPKFSTTEMLTAERSRAKAAEDEVVRLKRSLAAEHACRLAPKEDLQESQDEVGVLKKCLKMERVRRRHVERKLAERQEAGEAAHWLRPVKDVKQEEQADPVVTELKNSGRYRAGATEAIEATSMQAVRVATRTLSRFCSWLTETNPLNGNANPAKQFGLYIIGQKQLAELDDPPNTIERFRAVVGFLTAFPEWSSALSDLADNPGWAPYVAHWGVLTKSLHAYDYTSLHIALQHCDRETKRPADIAIKSLTPAEVESLTQSTTTDAAKSRPKDPTGL